MALGRGRQNLMLVYSIVNNPREQSPKATRLRVRSYWSNDKNKLTNITVSIQINFLIFMLFKLFVVILLLIFMFIKSR